MRRLACFGGEEKEGAMAGFQVGIMVVKEGKSCE